MLDDRDHFAMPRRPQHDRASALPEVLAHDRRVLVHAEEDDLARAPCAAMSTVHSLSAFEHRDAVAEHRLRHDGLDPRQIVERIDAAEPKVIGGDIGDDGNIAAVEAEAGTENAATRRLQHGVIDRRVLEDHLRAGRPAHVAGQDLRAVDVDAVGRRHADARPAVFMMCEIMRMVVVLPFVPVTATIGTRDWRAGREQHVDDRPADMPRVALGRIRVHAESGPGVDLDDRSARLPHGLGDI